MYRYFEGYFSGCFLPCAGFWRAPGGRGLIFVAGRLVGLARRDEERDVTVTDRHENCAADRDDRAREIFLGRRLTPSMLATRRTLDENTAESMRSNI